MLPAARKVLCIPFVPILADSLKNRSRVLELAARIAAEPEAPDIVVLPELALSGYLLESLSGEAALTAEEISQFAGELAETGVSRASEWVVGFALRDGGEIFNCVAVLRGGEVIHIHRKLFLPTYGMFDETRYFARGSAFATYQGALGNTAVMICEDAWHMELAFAASAKKSDAVVVVSASPARGITSANEFTSSARWRHRLQTFAESYGQKYIYCNRGGAEDGVLFDATSFVFDPLADYVPAADSVFFEGAKLYSVSTAAGMRHGFAGNSARQNDVLLMKKLLSEES